MIGNTANNRGPWGNWGRSEPVPGSIFSVFLGEYPDEALYEVWSSGNPPEYCEDRAELLAAFNRQFFPGHVEPQRKENT